MATSINYHDRTQAAFRSMVADILSEVAADGLPGNHHFFIAVDTTHPGVDIPPWLKDEHPEELVIVLQNWFQDLAVLKDRFSVTLSFNNMPETLVIPFAAMRSFVDPSVEFGLRFENGSTDDPSGDDDDDGNGAPLDSEPEPAEETRQEAAEVVSLDQFRR